MNFDYCEGQIHVIEAGDTLYNISRRHNVPLAMILRANPYVDVYNLQIGDEICIPMPMPTPSVPSKPVRPTPSVPSKPSRPTPSTPPECGMPILDYLTIDGDNLQQILDMFQISLEDLLKFNDLNGILLKPGIVLKIRETE